MNIFLVEPDAALDERFWDLKIEDGVLSIRSWNDARTGYQLITVHRCGYGIEKIECSDPCTPVVDI